MPSETTFAASAREQMILSQMPQVELLAKYMHRRCPREIELDDLISAGTVGLIKAVDRYDARRHCQLKTLAEHRIRGAILDYLRQLDPLPRGVRRFQKNCEAAATRLEKELGRVPSHSEVAETVSVSVTAYHRLSVVVQAGSVVSLDAIPGRERHASSRAAEAATDADLQRLRSAIRSLPRPERAVAAGLSEGKSTRELADGLQLHPTRISQLKTRAIAQLRIILKVDARHRHS